MINLESNTAQSNEREKTLATLASGLNREGYIRRADDVEDTFETVRWAQAFCRIRVRQAVIPKMLR